ncbi:MAG: DUF1580 domain-containing protein [Phycisphaerae bacterium]|nr:MAG: DUF1580 domain-containing protein [Phycisphaerae bacterium]
MIDVTSETLISLKDVCRLLEREDGTRPHLSCVFRWVNPQRGCRGRILETVVVGGRRFTTRAALLRFVDELSTPAVPRLADTPHCRRHLREQASRRVARELGIRERESDAVSRPEARP